MTTVSPPTTSFHSDTAPTPHIQLFPELYHIILPMLAKPELAQCCRVSRFFSSIASLKLYKELYIDFEREHTSPTFRLIESADQQEERNEDPDESIPRFDPLRRTFSFTTYLTIGHHTRELCDGLTPPDLPNLITLRLIGSGFEVCSYHEDILHVPTPCPFLVHLRPRRIVFGNLFTQHANRHIMISKAVETFPPDSVADLVVLVSSQYGRKDHLALASLGNGLSGSIRTLTLVVVTNSALKSAVATMVRGQRPSPEQFDHALALVIAMKAACESKAVMIKVVGSEAIYIGHFGALAVGATIQDFRSMMRLGAPSGWSVAEASARAEEIDFVALKDWDGEEQ